MPLIRGSLHQWGSQSQALYPKPSILLSPSGVVPLGGAVTVQCWGWHWHWHWYQNMRFLLYKDGNPNMLQDVEPRWDLADFLIRNVSWRDAGSYGCYYYSHWNPLIWSHPSDPVELVVLPAPGPSISVRPSGVIALGQVVTIRCQCRCGARRLFLYKGGMEIQELDAAGDGGEFTIPSARWEDGGAYSCRSHSRSEPPDWSYPSDTVWIIVAGERPSSASRGDVALGGAVTVQCRGRHQNVRFLLYKDGNPNALQNTEPAGNVAEFPIHSVSQRHAGSYSCYYYSHWNPPVWSHPSDPVELVVAGEGPAQLSRSWIQREKHPGDSPCRFLYRPHHWGRAVGTGRTDRAEVCVSRPVSSCLQSPNPTSPCAPAGEGSPWGES
uniref:Ig-like domain-containing protein n=1 Tax=Chrysemys picta bellii TaxID=8478 RepID=A0A8C3FVV6_CHRPI